MQFAIAIHAVYILRRLLRVFGCYIVCETMEDYKEGCLVVWANYMSSCNSIVYLKCHREWCAHAKNQDRSPSKLSS